MDATLDEMKQCFALLCGEPAAAAAAAPEPAQLGQDAAADEEEWEDVGIANVNGTPLSLIWAGQIA